ncbi:MAG: HAD family hydrolase [Desulfobacteraceae bacterium]|jgi:HAD superfamily hydrolase (TIGR01509 family)
MIDRRAIKVVAFDCDGVMFDSSLANRTYYNQLLEHVGLPAMTPEQFVYAHMHTIDETLVYLVQDQDLLASALQYRQQIDPQTFIRRMVIEPSLKALLERLLPRYGTAIATNRVDTMDRVLSEHGLEGQFDIVITASDVRLPKPDPEQLNVILTHFGIEPEQMVYIGDSPLDAQASHAATVPFIAYGNPNLSADTHIESLHQVGAILGL